MTTHDVVVVGAGHNGLVAAALLARSGLDVVVVERDTVPGGAVSTVERFPGYKVDRGSSAHIMIRHTGLVERLGLDRHGLRYVDCDPWAFAPAVGDSPAIVFRVDLDATCASIEASCGARDAQAYREFVGVWGPRSAAVMRMFGARPAPATFVRAFWGMPTRDGKSGRTAGPELAQEFLRSGDALLDSWFSSERLKAALAWFGAQSGPPMSEPGTAPMVGMAALMHSGPPGRAIGGSGALTTALISSLESDGGRVALGDAAVAIARAGDKWAVRTAAGVEFTAGQVIAACHILTTLDMLGEGGPDRSTIDRWRARIDVGPGVGSAIRVGTTALPEYAGLPAGLPAHGVHSGLGLMVTDRGHLARAHGDARAGDLPRRPVVLPMGFSAIDPSLAPPDRHMLTIWTQWHPYRLSGGRTWESVREEATDAVVAEMDSWAPGFADSIEHVYAQTPDRLESELGLVGGNVMHVDMSADQMFTFRPHPDLGGHTVPGTQGLFLAGASTHPGGGVSGLSGSIAAQAVLSARTRPVERVQSVIAGAWSGLRESVGGRR